MQLSPAAERQAKERLLALMREKARRRPIWAPLPGPQSIAYETLADIVGFGGAAGGGKTDLACGKALTKQRKAMILRRVGTELTGVLDRLEELLGSKDGYSGKDKIWRTQRRDGARLQIEFASLPNLGDEKGFQGRPHDFLVFDEAANFLEQQVRFLLGWLRTTVPGQHCQALMTFNPPTSAEGRWIVDFFGPWLNPKHPLYPTAPGALRWAASLPADAQHPNGRDLWVDDGRPFVLVDGEPCYDFNPADYKPTEVIKPKSRTFIPSRITDNPHLMGTGYMATLQALPEPLRSQMLNGDFMAGVTDDPWQVIPTAWVEAAMARWTKRSPKGEMLTLGVDVARGGKDNTTLAPKHALDGGGFWFDELKVEPGTQTPDGQAVAGLVVSKLRDGAPILLDVIGVGASPYDVLNGMGLPVHGINVAEKATGTDKSGRLRFLNLRAQLWWRMREALDPANDTGTALPPDEALKRELCAPRWSLSGAVVKVESRQEIIDRIGYSPDRATAVVLANMDMPKLRSIPGAGRQAARGDYDPYASLR